MTSFYPTEFHPLSSQAPVLHKPWWEQEGISLADTLFATANMLRTEQSYLRERYRVAIKMYENVECEDLDAWRFASPTNNDGPFQRNLAESVVDTVHAEIISNRTRPQFYTQGGQWDDQQRAKSLTTFTDGVFYENHIHTKVRPEVNRDALVFGIGWGKVGVETGGPDEGRVRAYRVFPWEVLFDDVEAANCPPTYMMHITLVSRHHMRVMFEGNAEAQLAIDRAPEHLFKSRPRSGISDIIEVIEAWKLKGLKSEGRHVMATKKGACFDKDWKKPYFPLLPMRYKSRTKGFHGKGVPEMIEGQHDVINSLHEKITAQILACSPFMWTPTGSQLVNSSLSNQIMRVVESDQKPEIILPVAVSPDLFAGLEREYKQANDQVGVNQVMMESGVPAGLAQGSGRQMRIYNDTKSKRFKRFCDIDEQWHIDLAEMMIDMIADVADAEGNYEVKALHDGTLLALDFKDIKLPKNSFVIRPAPTNFLSDTPSGRVADIEALAQIAPEQMKPYLFRLLQNPDVERATSMVAGSSAAVEKILNRLLYEKNRKASDCPPNPFMDLQEALIICKNIIVDAMSNDAPTDRIQRLIDWAKLCEKQLSTLTQGDAEAAQQQLRMQQMSQEETQAKQSQAPQMPGLTPQQTLTGPQTPVLQ